MRSVKATLNAYYTGTPDQRDDLFERVVHKHDGNVVGSGCTLFGEPSRDLQAEFEGEPDRQAIEQELRQSGRWEHIDWDESEDQR
jgi:hypothetical protein